MLTRSSLALTAMSFCLGSASSQGGEPIDPAQLRAMEQSLDSYLSRIRTLKLHYTSTWERDSTSEIARETLERQKRDIADRLKEASAEDRPALEEIAQRIEAEWEDECSLLYAFPSMKLDTVSRWRSADGGEGHDHFLKIVHDNRYVEVQFHDKNTHVKSGIDWSMMAGRPTEAAGIEIPGGPGNPLSMLLRFPGITTLEGHETLDGVETVVLAIGPGLPAGAGSKWFKEGSAVKLWLAPSLDFLPLRTEFRFYTPSDAVPAQLPEGTKRFEVQDFRPVKDLARGEELMFPHRMSEADAGGTRRWEIRGVMINVVTSEADFADPTPESFLVSRDGAVPVVELKGDATVRDRIARETTQAARELMGQSVPAAPRPSPFLSVRYLLPIGLGTAILAFYFIGRRHHAS